MIAPMSRFSFLVYHKDYQDFLQSMQSLGVLHLIEKQQEVSDEIRQQYDQLKQARQLIKVLGKRLSPDGHPKKDIKGGEEAHAEALGLLDEIEQKTQQLSQMQKEITQIRHWGDFSQQTIEKLKAAGLQLRYYSVSNRKFNPDWLQEYPIEVVSRRAGLTWFVMLVRGGEEYDLDAEEVRPPARPVSALISQRDALRKEVQEMEKALDKLAGNKLEAVKHYFLQLQENIEYKKVEENTQREADDKVMLLEGWVPGERKEDLIAFLEEQKILYVAREPKGEDKPPILLKNKSFSSRFEMLGDLYSLPKYNELDMTPFFAPFYMLFFGFCLGDAGYGILMAAAALLMKKRVQKTLQSVMGLVFYLGLSTFFFGVIGGTFFGIPLYETGLPVYSSLAERFQDRGTDINQLLFYLALVFGGTQILFGLFLKAINEIRQFGWGFALGTLGWIILLCGLLILYLISYLSGVSLAEMSIPLYVLLGISGLLILPLNNLGRNMLLNVGVGLWNTYNMVTGLLGDLLSYIRLFALGISSAIMGFVFNSLAVEMSGSIPVLNILIMIVILVFGHGINIFMSGLGAFVHPLRLTFVEFYKNAGFSGGGKHYKPFRKIT